MEEQDLQERIDFYKSLLQPRGPVGRASQPETARELLGDLATLEAVFKYEHARERIAKGIDTELPPNY